EVAGIAADQSAAPLAVRKLDPEAGLTEDPVQRLACLGHDPVDQAGGEYGRRLAAVGPAGLNQRTERPLREWQRSHRKKPAHRTPQPRRGPGGARPRPHLKQRALAQGLAMPVTPVLQDLARQRDLDRADLLAGVALGAERVG